MLSSNDFPFQSHDKKGENFFSPNKLRTISTLFITYQYLQYIIKGINFVFKYHVSKAKKEDYIIRSRND